MRSAAELALLLHADQAVAVVVEDQRDERHLLAHRGLQLLGIHQEAAIARDGNHVAIRVQQLGGDRARQADSHRGEPIGDDAGVRPVAGVEAGDPHLVGTNVGHQDVVRAEHRA